MTNNYIDYLVKNISVALLLSLLIIAYINIIVIFIPPPEEIKEKLIQSTYIVKETLANASTIQDVLMYMLKNGMHAAMYVFIPLIGPIHYLEMITGYAWGISIATQERNAIAESLLILMSTPTIYLQLLSYALLTIEGNKIFFNIIKRKYTSKIWMYHIAVITVALLILLLSIVLDTVLLFLNLDAYYN